LKLITNALYKVTDSKWKLEVNRKVWFYLPSWIYIYIIHGVNDWWIKEKKELHFHAVNGTYSFEIMLLASWSLEQKIGLASMSNKQRLKWLIKCMDVSLKEWLISMTHKYRYVSKSSCRLRFRTKSKFKLVNFIIYDRV